MMSPWAFLPDNIPIPCEMFMGHVELTTRWERHGDRLVAFNRVRKYDRLHRLVSDVETRGVEVFYPPPRPLSPVEQFVAWLHRG